MELERLQRQLIDQSEELAAHVKLLRDYGTTPDSLWLAKGELNRINELSAEIDQLLAKMKQTT